MTRPVTFSLNGHPARADAEAAPSLLQALRDQLGLTGTKYGCGTGLCGACTVTVSSRAVRACRTSLEDIQGQAVTTVEGLGDSAKLHPLQQAFVEHDALQCGYCTPGMLMSAQALLVAKPDASRADIAQALEHNLCRCGAHQRILDAVEAAAVTLRRKGAA